MTSMTRRGFVKVAALASAAPKGLRAMAAAPAQAAQQGGRAAAPAERFDYVFAGAGHNALVCAAYMAKAGYRVLLLEGRPTIGGGAKTREVLLPGFRSDLCSSVHGGIQSNPLLRDNELNLRDYGLEYLHPSDPALHIPFLDGASITIWREDLERTYADIARISRTDAETFRRLVPARKAYLEAPAADRARLPHASFWEQLATLSGYDAARVIWESDHLRAASLVLGRTGSVPGGSLGTGNQALSLIGRVITNVSFPKGGSGMLSVALGRFLEAHHAVIVTNKPVVRLIVEHGRCAGVECADGSQYRARRAVVSTIHPKQIAEMAPRHLWGDAFLDRVRLFQPEWAFFQFHYATTEPPKYSLASGGTISCFEAMFMNRPERILQHAYDDARGEVNLEDLPFLVRHHSGPDHVPAGCAVLKTEGHLPYGLKEGPQHWDAIKDRVADAVFDSFRRFAPNLTPDKILAKFLLSPLDIERMNPAMWRGGGHHGNTVLLPQQLVPHRMPIPGLYQTGACTLPGPNITGWPGRNAAAVILEDLGKSIKAVGRARARV